MIFARKLYIKVAVIIGLTFILTSAIIYFSINNSFSNIINRFMSNRLDSALQQINVDFDKVMWTTTEIAEKVRVNYQSMTKTDYEKMLEELVSSKDSIFSAGVWFEPYKYKNKKYFGPYVFRDQGRLIYSESWGNANYDYFHKAWYRCVFEHNESSVWTPPYEDEILNLASITNSKKIVASDGSVLGVATANINISKIREDINYSLRLGDNSKAFLVDKQGNYISLNDQIIVLAAEAKGNPLLSDIVSNIAALDQQTNYYDVDLDDYNVSIKKTDFPGWYIGIAVPRGEVWQVIKTSFLTISVAILLLAVVIVSIMRLSSIWIKHVFFENAVIAAAIIDQEMKISLVNRGFMELTGFWKEELEEHGFSELLNNDDIITMKRQFDLLKKTAKNEARYEVQIKSKDNSVKDIIISMGLIKRTQYAMVSLIDITNHRTMEKKLEYFSFHDVLTGLYNRTYFAETLKQLETENSYALIICDVDNQKLVNDTFGHAAGDQMLSNVSGIISRDLEPTDIAARIGGDEFVIIIRGERSKIAEELCERIQERIKEFNSSQSIMLMSLSIGFARCTNKDKTSTEVYIEADNNMYREKIKYKQGDRSSKIENFMKILEARDYEKEGHTQRLIELSSALAAKCYFSERRTCDLKLLARYHDIGKIGISELLLSKKDPLTSDEKIEIRRHCEIGYNIAKSSRELSNIADFILKHHEWWNGEGYPLGIRGEEIPLECRIISVLDTYDAMTKDRSYRKALTHEEAVTELTKRSGTQFDPKIVDIFLALFVEQELNAYN